MPQPIPIEDRYWSHVDRRGPDECWPWIGSTSSGYGRFWDGTYLPTGSRRMALAHRWAYKTFLGPVPDDIEVCHNCDNRPCQNLTHWFLGTQQDNMDDKVAKGRQARLVGESNPGVKLTSQQVDAIRHQYATGAVSMRILGEQYQVARTTIGDIINGRTWTN